MSEQEQEPTQTQPENGAEPQIEFPPTQFLMFPEGFKVNVVPTPMGDSLAITGMQTGQFTHVEATMMVPLDQVEAFCQMCVNEAKKAQSPAKNIIRASADTDLASLAEEARRRSGI